MSQQNKIPSEQIPETLPAPFSTRSREQEFEPLPGENDELC